MSFTPKESLPPENARTRDSANDMPRKADNLESQEDAGPQLTVFVAITCIVLVAIDLRPAIVSVGPLLSAIRAEFAISNAQASLLTAIPALLMGLFAFPTPGLARRFGRDTVMLTALTLLAIAVITRAFSYNSATLFLTTAGVGAGIAVAGTLVAGFIKKSYPERIALFTGIYATAIGLGSTLSALLTGPIAAADGGWRLSAGIFVIPGIVAIAAWLVIARAERRSASVRPSTSVDQASSALPFKSGTAWLVALYFSLNNVLFFGMIAWIAPMFVEYGMNGANAALLLASFTAAFMVANFLAGISSRNRDRRLMIGLFSGASLVGAVLLALVPLAAPFMVVPLIAFGIGGSFTLGMVLPLDHAKNANEANSWTAFVLGIGYSVGALGPFLLGLARDMTDGFALPIWILVSVAVLKLIIGPLLDPRRT